MKKVHWIALLALLATTIFFIGLFVHQYRTRSDAAKIEERIELRNQTRAIEVVSQKIEGEGLQLQIKNAGRKPVIAYRIDLRDQDRFNVDFSIGSPLEHNRISYVSIPLKNLIIDEKTGASIVEISMALFVDGTGEGDQAKLQIQRQQMIGMARAYRDLFELVNKLQTFSDLTSTKFIEQVTAQTMLMPSGLNDQERNGYLKAIESLKVRARTLEKLPDEKSKDIRAFKEAFVRHLRNLNMIAKQETQQ
jgi:hypothetical protein